MWQLSLEWRAALCWPPRRVIDGESQPAQSVVNPLNACTPSWLPSELDLARLVLKYKVQTRITRT